MRHQRVAAAGELTVGAVDGTEEVDVGAAGRTFSRSVLNSVAHLWHQSLQCHVYMSPAATPVEFDPFRRHVTALCYSWVAHVS